MATKSSSVPPAGFAGLRIIGDVHGERESFAAAIAEARALGLYVVQLGDLVDRGPDSAGALALALDLVASGEGVFLRSNHDDKLRRALVGNPVRIGVDLARTLASLDAVPDPDAFRARVAAGLEAAPWWLHWGDLVLVHAAFHPAMLETAAPDEITPRRVADKVRWLALYGEGRMATGEELPTRTYGWIDTVPDGVTVLIGHDVVSTAEIVERRGAAGGRVLFCDTGSGKGGKLSWVDLLRADGTSDRGAGAPAHQRDDR